MKTKKIIRKLDENQYELTEREKIQILAIVFNYPPVPTATEMDHLEKVLRLNSFP